tara:strand:+ start:16075 stop:16821 length:747 start_codon:yes stop_codon:yes gene_type:complete
MDFDEKKQVSLFITLFYILPIIFIILLVVFNEFINIISFFSIGSLIYKFFISFNVVNGINNYYPNDIFRNYAQNLQDIVYNAINNQPNVITICNNYLPVVLFNGLLMIILYIIAITKLRVDLSLASNCYKNNYTTEYTTLRKKINDFAKNNDIQLKLYLIVLLVSLISALLFIFILTYNNNIEIQYIIIVPILLFLIVFSSIIIDRINKNNFDNSYYKTHNKHATMLTILSYVTIPLIGLIGASLLIV